MEVNKWEKDLIAEKIEEHDCKVDKYDNKIEILEKLFENKTFVIWKGF